MISIEEIAIFVGWCTVINIGLLLLALIAIAIFHDFVGDIAGKIFGVSSEDAKIVLLQVFQQFRLVVIFFNLVPYIALKIMATA